MRVLIISALRGLDPQCGDVIYTETLLKSPPAGVEYETYDQALKRGTLTEHYTSEKFLQEWRSGGNWLPELIGGMFRKAINQLRISGLMFSEPFRFFSIQPGAYDLVHVHVFHIAFLELPCPFVFSAGCPTADLYAHARRWPEWRVRLAELLDRIFARLQGINLCSQFLTQVTRFVCYTHSSKRRFVRAGVLNPDKIDVVPIYMEPSANLKLDRIPQKILFVARDFKSKGGEVLLKAFEKVRLERPDAELHIIGSEPLLTSSEALSRNIAWMPIVPRQQLLEMIPNYDIFAYPSQFDCVPYVLLEAMSRGLPIATSDFESLPEVVDFGWAGKISPVGDSDQLSRNLLELLEPETNKQFSKAALDRFKSNYCTDVVTRKLLRCYEACIASVCEVTPVNIKSSSMSALARD